MLRFIRQGQRWVVTAVVAAIGGVFVLFFGPWDFTQSAGGGEVPITVDGVQYRQEDVARVRDNLESRLRDQLGDQFDALSDNLQLQDRAVRQLVDRAILAGEARRMGLTASDAEVQRLIVRAFADFRDAEGRPDEEQARAYVNYEWGSVRRFKEEVRTDLVLGKLGRVLFASAGVSQAEARESIRYQEEEARIAFVALDPNAVPASVEVLPGDVEEFARTAADRVQAFYDESLERYQLPERIRLRHVLVRRGDDPDAARERAEAVRERIAAGEDMASVAREVSEDEGSRELGGDLGLLPVSEVSQALRDAVADLEDGELSPVVEGDLGFHVVRREQQRPAETRPLEEVRLEIAEELYRAERAVAWATENADALAARIAEGESLEDAARDLQLPIERTAFFRRRPDGYIPDLGDSTEVQTATFALGQPGATWPHPLAVGAKTVFIQLLERRGPDAGEIEAQVEAEQERLAQQAQARAEQMWLADRRAELQAQGKIWVDPSILE
jgi:peptidyl-prolyl cis-trans isomerase D